MSKTTTCRITIRNQSNDTKRFLLFQDAPKPKNLNSSEVFYNVFQTSPRLKSGENSMVRFEMDSKFFAIHGTAQKNAVGPTRVYTSDSMPVKLGPDGTVAALTTIDDESPCWNDTVIQSKKSDAKGGFNFVTDSSFKYPNKANIYIGLGAPDATGSVIPVQTYVAKPSQTNQLFPKLRYYICTGEHHQGMIVDRNEIGVALKVDFTGCAVPEAYFIMNSNGTFVDDEGQTKKNLVKWEVSEVTEVKDMALSPPPESVLTPTTNDGIDEDFLPDAIVTIRNKSALPESFVIFPVAPTFSSANVPAQINLSIYQASLRVASRTGSTTFTLTFPNGDPRSLFAVTGCGSHGAIRELYYDHARWLGAKFRSSPQQRQLQPWRHDGRGGKHFQAPPIADGHADAPFIGIGAVNPSNPDDVVPVVTWTAIPGSVYILAPSLDWRCARGHAVAGEIIDLTDWQPAATIPSLRPGAEREVKYQSNGQFEVIQLGHAQ
ncbi:uncharacterized protein ACLA_060030 [Aspergillus clavatus NRRL 1]|uniref:Uncharacterized protein n=1 Tax=Aspergillus clavatus (strain ATCC 1007 / CBS 513.65 / DSM 816 / NCTC 3887 / NRRL 1 / QM 1276 / 107) TaxID=344612 RepID=A1C4J6_ASPCL|nr:uncharacterized protein ACLA_060030 [Aspergillus clavatus NRRL 1]EAW15336.1 hypothetical protein ACLA_060030 [Aspergillus clavatus NRRL 1]